MPEKSQEATAEKKNDIPKEKKVVGKIPQAYKYVQKRKAKEEKRAAKEQAQVVPGGTSLSKKNVKPVVSTKFAKACVWHTDFFDGCKTCYKFKLKLQEEKEQNEIDDPMELKVDVKGSCFWHATYQSSCKACQQFSWRQENENQPKGILNWIPINSVRSMIVHACWRAVRRRNTHINTVQFPGASYVCDVFAV